ncbi:hypothetical protein K501DRAFT_287621 [Backusella circina FSU 941]|nr:hypothetical protein K501DRAFT_287621 [Backusella circina FSU 941]
MKVTFLITAFLSTTLALPILSKIAQPSEAIITNVEKDKSGDNSPLSFQNEQQPSTPQDIYYVQPERLAQVIATHIQFDHLDAVISNTDKVIAGEFQHHIKINIQQNHDSEESKLMSHNANQYAVEMMDLEILQSQISAAIQAHTEGSLPLAWDTFAEKLGRVAIESYILQSLSHHCGDDMISTVCLDEHATTLATSLDEYIMSSLKQVFDALDQHALPDLLQHTARDLKGILNYFNESLLDNKRFTLDVLPWATNDEAKVHRFKSKLLEIALPQQKIDEADNHSTAFFKEYVAMARV